MKLIITTLFIFVNSQCYLIVEDTKTEYSVFRTMYGFYPYGRSIEGNMHFVKDLCTNSHSGKSIIVTEFSRDCNAKVQLYNAREALAIIFVKETFDEVAFLEEFYTETATIISVLKTDLQNIKKSFNSRIQLTFPILIQTEKPLVEYIVYELTQQIEVLKILDQFKKKGFSFDLEIIYFVIHSQKVDQDCLVTNLLTLPILESSVQYTGLKINCRSQFETKYLIKTNRDSQLTRTQILQEEIRQICTLQIYGIELWRQYRSQFTNKCLQLQQFLEIYHCSMDVRHSLLMEEDQVQSCYTNSFYNQNHSNKILDEQLNNSVGLGQWHHKERATLKINSQVIYGNYSFDVNTLFDSDKSSLFLALCGSYQEKNRPQACFPIIESIQCNFYCGIKLWVSQYALRIIISVLIIGTFLISLYYLRRKQQLRLKGNIQIDAKEIEEKSQQGVEMQETQVQD